MMIADIFLYAVAAALSIPAVVIFVQVASACLPRARLSFPASPKAIVAVLVPAHDEEEGIVATIKSILPQLKSGDRLLVVADNCSDNTARIASDLSAEVIVRHDLANRGKGFALDYGIQFLAQEPPDVVVIVDADCIVAEDALGKLVACSVHYDKPVQGLYLMLAPKGARLKAKLAEFAWVVKNLVRPLGYARLGFSCQLMGSGMAFPWPTISNANLANGNIVEDLKLGIDLSRSGKSPLFYADALVTSQFPTASKAQSEQRTRWEHGHLSMIISQAPSLVAQGIARRNKDLLAIALDLCVPPLALLVVMLVGFLIVAGLSYFAGASYMPFLIAVLSFVLLATAIFLAWLGWGRNIIPLVSFLLIPFYVASKIPNYFRFIFNRQKEWIRTARK